MYKTGASIRPPFTHPQLLRPFDNKQRRTYSLINNVDQHTVNFRLSESYLSKIRFIQTNFSGFFFFLVLSDELRHSSTAARKLPNLVSTSDKKSPVLISIDTLLWYRYLQVLISRFTLHFIIFTNIFS